MATIEEIKEWFDEQKHKHILPTSYVGDLIRMVDEDWRKKYDQQQRKNADLLQAVDEMDYTKKLKARVAELEAKIDCFPPQLRRIAKEIQDEGHLGWGNELNDIAAAIKGEDS